MQTYSAYPSTQTLIKKPFRVLMVTGIYPTEEQPHSGTFIKSQTDSLIAAGIEVVIIHPKAGPVALRYIYAAIQVLLKTATEHFDVVHGHFGLYCLAARLQWRAPVVASFLGSDLLGKVGSNGKYTRKGDLVVQISRWLCRRADAVIVKSEGMKKATSGGNIFIIPNGVDFELFRSIPRAEARARLGWDHERFYILFGNDPKNRRKNFSLAQAAVSCLQARGIPAELVVANGLPQTTLVNYINASNVLILTSIHEGSPNIVKETMACNVPVVSTDVGDVAQVIAHTRGCKVCPHVPSALAAALEEALEHTGPTTGRKDISHLQNPLVAEQILAVYKQATSKKLQRL